jgi:hypothetical protein
MVHSSKSLSILSKLSGINVLRSLTAFENLPGLEMHSVSI